MPPKGYDPEKWTSPTVFEVGDGICRLIDDLLAEVYGVRLGEKNVKIRVESIPSPPSSSPCVKL